MLRFRQINGSAGYHLVASSIRQTFRLRGMENQWLFWVPPGGVKLPAELPAACG